MDHRAPDNNGKYRVQVGHLEVTVCCRSPEEAIRLARRQFSHDLPRMWDVLHTMEERQFRVDQLPQ